MSSGGEQLTQQILDELTCPNCQYLLRGLSGPIVNCPECGTPCDLPQMVAQKWAGPWQAAPLYSQLLYPVAFATMSPPVLLLIAAWETALHGNGAVSLTTGLGMIAAWGMLLARARRQFGDDRGVDLSLAAHGLMLGYITGVAGIIASLVWVFATGSPAAMFGAIIVIAGMVMVLIRCRRCERSIGEECIRQHLTKVKAQTAGQT